MLIDVVPLRCYRRTYRERPAVNAEVDSDIFSSPPLGIYT